MSNLHSADDPRSYQQTQKEMTRGKSLQIFNRAGLLADDVGDLTYHEALAEQLYISLREALKRINELEAKYEGHTHDVDLDQTGTVETSLPGSDPLPSGKDGE